MDLMIRSFNFRTGSFGSVRLSDPKKSGPSAGRIAIAATPEASVGSCGKVNSLVSIKPKKGSIVEDLGELMENLDLEESSGSTDTITSKKLDNILKKDIVTTYGDVSKIFHGVVLEFRPIVDPYGLDHFLKCMFRLLGELGEVLAGLILRLKEEHPCIS
jgi:hypothetical protein